MTIRIIRAPRDNSDPDQPRKPKGAPGGEGGEFTKETGSGGGSGANGESQKEELDWDEVDDYAKSLKIEDFGTPEEIAEMAKPIRSATNRKEADEALKGIVAKGLMTSKSGLVAKLPSNNRSEVAHIDPKNIPADPSEKFHYYRAHFLAAANLDKLFENAIEPKDFTLNPNKNNQDIKRRHYLFSPLEYEGKIYPVTITVKEFKEEKRGTNIYAIEFIDVEIGQKKSGVSLESGVFEKTNALSLSYVPASNTNISHLFDSVNVYLENIKFFLENYEPEEVRLARGRERYSLGRVV